MAELLVLSPKPEDFWLASNIRLNTDWNLRLIRPPMSKRVTTMPPTPMKVCSLRPRISSMKLPNTATANDQQLMMTWICVWVVVLVMPA